MGTELHKVSAADEGRRDIREEMLLDCRTSDEATEAQRWVVEAISYNSTKMGLGLNPHGSKKTSLVT